MTDETRVRDSGAVALEGGTVNISGGAVAAGRDVFVRELNILLADHAPSGDSITVPGHAADVCPYPGLEPFRGDDADFFFGREDDARAVTGLVGVGRLAAVIGSSGSGKSSLLSAAVVPALSSDGGQGPRYLSLELKPGRTPVELVADRLAQHLPGSSAVHVASEFRGDPARLSARADEVAESAGLPVMWVVDQLEEVFDPTVPEADRRLLLDGLRPGRQSGVLLAMRSDFYQHLDASPELARLVADRQHRLTPLDEEALRQVIVGPAERVHLRVEPELVQLVVSDAARSGGALPFVALALKETWRRRANGWLTVSGYLAGGGVSGAVQQTADGVWARLDPVDRPTAKRMLMRMAHMSDEGSFTRRRCPATEFVTDLDDEPTVIRVLGTLVRSRLLTMDAGIIGGRGPAAGAEAASVPTVEITHDTVLTAWTLLRSWLVADHDSKRLQDDLAGAADEWSRSGSDAAFLYTGIRLATLLAAQDALTPNSTEAAFIRASKELAQHQRRRALLLVALPIGLVVALVVAGLTFLQLRETARAKTQSDALQLAAEAVAVAGDDRDRAALLASAADTMAHGPTTWGTLVDTLGDLAGPVALIRSEDGLLNSMSPTFIGPGRIVTAASDGTVQATPADNGADGQSLGGGPSVVHVRVSEGSVLTEDVTGTVVLFTPGGDSRLELSVGAGSQSEDLLLDARHHLIAAAGRDGRLRRWWYDVGADGRARVAAQDAVRLAATSIAADGDGGLVAATLQGSLSYLPKGASSAPIELAGERTLRGDGSGLPYRITVGSGGQLAAVDGTRLLVWSLATSDSEPHLSQMHAVPYPGGTAVVADPKGGGLITGTRVGTLTQWVLAPGPARQSTFSGGGTGTVQVLATDGDWVAALVSTTAGPLGPAGDRVVATWDLNRRRSPAITTWPDGDLESWSAAYGPEGRLAVGAADGRVAILSRAAALAGSQPEILAQLPDVRVTHLAWWGDRVVAGGADNSATAIAPDGSTSPLVPAGPSAVVGIDATENLAVVGWEDGRIAVFGPDGTQSQYRTGAGSASVAVSRDGRWLAAGAGESACAAGTGQCDILLWDLRGSDSPHRLHGHEQFVAALAFSPDGRLLASGGDDQSVQLWSTDSGEPLASMEGHRDTVRALAFSPDGETLASTGDDGTIRLWDTGEHASVGGPLDVADGPLFALSAEPGGGVVTAAGSGDLVEVPLRPAAWHTRACSFAGRSLTRAEEIRYLGADGTALGVCD